MLNRKLIFSILFLVMIASFSIQSIQANPSGTNILITEVLYDTPGTDSIEEWVELYNPTDSDISISGWTISDNYGTFSLSGVVPARGYFVIASDATGFSSLYGYDPDLTGMSLALGNSGDQLILEDDSSTEVDFVAWENYVTGWSISATYTSIRRITSTDTDSVSDWENSGTTGDPGTGNYGSVTDSIPPVVTITNPINGATVSGSATISFTATDDNGISTYSINIDGTEVSTTNSYSWDTTSYSDGSHTILCEATDPSNNLGSDSITVTVTVDNSGSQGNPSLVVINEFLADPYVAYTEEWIELYNPQSVEVDISGYILDDITSGGTSPYTIPTNSIVPAYGFIVFYQSTTNIALNNAGDTLNYLTPSSSVIDSHAYSTSTDDISEGRETDGSSTWITFTTPTPGTSNGVTGSDTTPPDVTIINPINGVTISGLATISFTATDDNGISTYSINIDGTEVSTTNSFSWDTTSYSDGSYVILCEASDPSSNLGSDSVTVIVNNSAPQGDPSLVVINEFLADPYTEYTEEWIELYNPQDVEVDISGYILDDITSGGTSPYTIPTNSIVPAYGFIVFYQGTTNIGLNNAGDTLNYLTPSSSVIDSHSYPSSTDDISEGRETDGSSIWTTFTAPTPGTSNGVTGPDTTPPSVAITSPADGITIYGTINIAFTASDASGIITEEIYLDDVLISSSLSYVWNTTLETDGIHTILVKAEDGASNWGEDTHSITVDNTNPPPPVDQVKFMVFNIKESGESYDYPDWKEVVKEENADIIMFVETGYWDDNSNAKLNQYVDEFNSYFTGLGEDPYVGYTTQGITYSTSGEAIMSRYPVISTNQLLTVPLDDSTNYDVTHDFYDCVVQIGDENVHIIGAHLKAMPGAENEERREWEQEGIINYMDTLGNVPILYLGDLNSFSTEDWGLNTLQTGLGYGPLSMMISPYLNPETSIDYSQYAPTVQSYTDVFRSLNPLDLGISNPEYDSRIDFIYANQLLESKMISSTTGDTIHALTGSDHLSVDVIIDFGDSSDTDPPEQIIGLTATAVSGSQINLNWDASTADDLDYYTIYRDSVLLTTTTATSYSDTGLTSETSYSYEVSATDTSSNEGILSVSASDTTSDITPPTQVTGLLATVISGSQIDLHWDTISVSDLDYYTIYRDSILLTTTSSTSYSDTGLTSETTYSYEVSATDTSDNEGILSVSVSETTWDITPPAQVIGLTVDSTSTEEITISWNANTEDDVDYYNIFRDNINIATISSGTSFTDTGLTPETSYAYEVSAVDISGNEGLKSSIVVGTTDSAPTTPTVLISEVYYDAIGVDSRYEWIELYNYGNSATDISGWTLSDTRGTFTLSSETVIQPGQFLVVARSSIYFYTVWGFYPDVGGMSISLGNRGDSVTLRDSSGVTQDFVAWENCVSGWDIYASTGYTIARIDPNIDTDSVADWTVLPLAGTPGRNFRIHYYFFFRFYHCWMR